VLLCSLTTTNQPNQIHQFAIMDSVQDILRQHLAGLDTDILDYLISIIDNMTGSERKNPSTLEEVILPFLVDTEYCDANMATTICRNVSVSFGGSGMKQLQVEEEEELPTLLSAPIKMLDHSDLNKAKATYGPPIGSEDEHALNALVGNSNLDISSVPVTQKQARKLRKEKDVLQRLLQIEALARELEEEELRVARMAAIKASRASGRQANTGVNIERFSLPHPSGTGDLLTDASLTMAKGRRYGLIGKNGAGKDFVWMGFAYVHKIMFIACRQINVIESNSYL
jgi:ATP-binding cassette subfamily F protein 3